MKRSSTTGRGTTGAVVTDTVLISAIEESLNSPAGALYPYRNLATDETDIDSVYAALLVYWRGVRAVFPDAWGLPATRSRLMHGAGIRSMSRLMDRLMVTIDPHDEEAEGRVIHELAAVAPFCRWTAGTWEELGVRWDAPQNLSKDIQMLSNFLLRTYAAAARQARV